MKLSIHINTYMNEDFRLRQLWSSDIVPDDWLSVNNFFLFRTIVRRENNKLKSEDLLAVHRRSSSYY